MQTLKECYVEIINDHNRWSYYRNPPSFCHALDSEEHAFQFIKDYFTYGGKSQAFEDNNLAKHKTQIEKRAIHIVSAFLLGIKIAECFKIDTCIRDAANMSFMYYWFLTCLYHDIGYVYENVHDDDRLRMVHKDGIEALKKICDLKYVHNRVFKTYPKEIINFYLKKRADCREAPPKLDHGIVGGLLLYDKLRKQFEKSWVERTDKAHKRGSFCVPYPNGERCLHLSNKHYDAHAKAADAIITHNIWTKTLKQYIENDSALLTLPHVDFSKKITLKNRLCFLLALADTIEPAKRKRIYLERIRISSLCQGKGFALYLKEDDFEELHGSIISLEEWVSVNVLVQDRFDGYKSIEITIGES